MHRVLFIAALASASAALAQAPPSCSLAGVVLDAATQKPIPDALVTAHSAALTGEQSATTDANGAFEMTFLPAGTYGLSVKRDGYAPFSPEGLELKARRTRIKLLLVPPEAAPPPAPDFDANTMTQPVLVAGPNIDYTQEALERGVEGTMTVRCVITAQGAVRDCKVEKGLPFMNAACTGALEARRYKPVTQQGKPVDVLYTFTLKFKLPN